MHKLYLNSENKEKHINRINHNCLNNHSLSIDFIDDNLILPFIDEIDDKRNKLGGLR